MNAPRGVTVVNVTGHVVRVYAEDGSTIDIPPSPKVARCVVEPDRPHGEVSIEGIAVPVVISATTGTVVDLPEPRPDVLLIVSRMVASALPHRRDLVFPHHVVRDDNGHPLGCRVFGQVPLPESGLSTPLSSG